MSDWSIRGAGTTRCFVLEMTSQCGCHGEPWAPSKWNVNIDGYGSSGRVYHSRSQCRWQKAAQAKAIHGPGASCRVTTIGSGSRLHREVAARMHNLGDWLRTLDVRPTTWEVMAEALTQFLDDLDRQDRSPEP